MEEKKQIKVSLGTTVCLFIIFLLVIALVGMWYYYNRIQPDNSGVNAEKQTLQETVADKDVKTEYKEWVDEEKGIKLKYPSKWGITLGNDYMEPTKIQSSEDEGAARVYITSYKNEENTAKEILEDTTKPDYGVSTEELNSEEEIVQIEEIDEALSKVQLMTYDDGTTSKVKTIVYMKDSIVYIFKFVGEETEYEKYYQEFENILKTVEIRENEKKEVSDYKYKETITLNNKTHEIGFVYEEINSKNQEEHFQSEELEIFFDGKKIKTYTVYRQEWEKQENPEIQIIEGEDNKQYAIIVVGNINPVTTEYQFDFINDNGEIIGLADYYGGTGMNYKGKELSYKINETNMEIYKPIMIGESGNDFVIKYVLRVGNNFVNYSAEEIYKASEVEFSGSRR